MSDGTNVPKWMEARAAIRERIHDGTLAPGQKLPAEPELAASLGVSRATLREALRSLAEDGYLSRKPGAGTHVSQGQQVATNLNSNFGVADIIRSMGMVPGTQSMKIEVVDASEDVAKGLGVKAGSRVAIIERVRTADGRPMVFSTSYFPVSDDNGRAQKLRSLGHESLYTVLERLAGVHIEYGNGTLMPALANEFLAEQLSIPIGSLLMHLRQIDYDDRGIRVMLSSEYYVSEAFRFSVLRKGTRSFDAMVATAQTMIDDE